jgi:pimeloyl-ACP methyl ester carboxylesterase
MRGAAYGIFAALAISACAMPVRSEESSFIASDTKTKVSLAGTLSHSVAQPSIATVILLTGSGPLDRDETMFGHKPFKTITDYFVARGITVLRYDKRGVGESKGPLAGTTADFADDAEAVLDFASKTLAGPYGFIGHSEGGVIGALVAARRTDVDFLITLGSNAVKGERLWRDQVASMHELSGATPEHIRSNDVYVHRLIDASLQSRDALVRETEAVRMELNERQQWAAAQIDLLSADWMRWFLAYDPAPTLASLKIPVLALYGEKDRQVLAVTNGPVAQAALAANPRARVQIVPGVNHLFQTAATGSPSEYATITEDISSAVLNLIVGWLDVLSRK